jgi:hypothetical protein
MFEGEAHNFGDHIEEILALDELHDEIDEIGVLDEFVEADDEGGARYSPQNFLLVHDVLDDLRLLHVGAV